MKSLISLFTKLCERFLPDAFGFCLLLTALVFVAACGLTPHGPVELIRFWGDSLWSLNGFAFQMAMVLVSGHMLAQAPFMARRLQNLAALPRNGGEALVLLSFISLLACWINWGFGLIVAALFSKTLAQKFPRTSFGVLIATGYAGFVIWHGGLSGSIPLSIAGEDKILKMLSLPSISLSETTFSGLNLILCAALFVVFPIVAWMLRQSGEVVSIPSEASVEDPRPVVSSFRTWMEYSRIPMLILIALGVIYQMTVIREGKSPDINFVNLTFVTLAALSLGNMHQFLKALHEAVKNVGGILIQYPMYAGLMGLMQSSGLGDLISQLFVSWSTPQTFALFSFWSAGLLNFFVPSGGGQWVVQGPILMKASQSLGVPLAKTAMAISWGDAWTNLVQPFWALPLLSLAKLELKDIMGPCVIYLIISGVVISCGMLLL